MWWWFIYPHLLIMQTIIYDLIYHIWYIIWYDIWQKYMIYIYIYDILAWLKGSIYVKVVCILMSCWFVCIFLYPYIERHSYFTFLLIWLPGFIVKVFTLDFFHTILYVYNHAKKQLRGCVYMNTCTQYEWVYLLNKYPHFSNKLHLQHGRHVGDWCPRPERKQNSKLQDFQQRDSDLDMGWWDEQNLHGSQIPNNSSM